MMGVLIKDPDWSFSKWIEEIFHSKLQLSLDIVQTLLFG